MQIPIITVPNDKLREKSKKITSITPELREFMMNLKETLDKAEDPEGVAIAAPQVGRNIRLFIMKTNNKHRFYINPEILDVSDKMTLGGKPDNPTMEGCLSIPHIYGPVLRPYKIKIRAIDINGETITKTMTSFKARVFQHEYDHLEGILFTDYTLKQNQPLYLEQDGQFTEIPNPKDIIKW